MRYIEVHSIICMYYYTILLYMDGVYGYIWLSIVPVCLLQPLQYESIPLLESRILLYFFFICMSPAISQSRNSILLRQPFLYCHHHFVYSSFMYVCTEYVYGVF